MEVRVFGIRLVSEGCGELANELYILLLFMHV